MIKIKNNDIAMVIKNELIRSGKFRLHYEDNNDFSQEELDSIKKIGVCSLSSLDGIQYLRYLETLNIYNSPHDVKEESLNRITDFSLLSKLKRLKKLYILNDAFIESVDVSLLENLEELVLVSNKNLREVVGVNALQKLSKLIVVGNDNRCYMNMEQYLRGLSGKIILDIFMYRNLFLNAKNLSEYLSLAKEKGVMFAEKIGFGEMFVLNLNQARDMHNKYNKIIRSLIDAQNSDREMVRVIYYFVVSHLSYDYSGLKKRAEYLIKNSYAPFLENNAMNNFRKLNSSYGALYRQQVVCEGYVNMMRLLLSLVNINSRTVFCHSKKEDGNEYEHAAIAIQIDGEWLFTDPEKYGFSRDEFLKTKKEFLDEYLLSPIDIAIYDEKGKKNKY